MSRTDWLETRPLVEGAMLAAVAAALVLIWLYVPVLGGIATFVWPVPIVLIAARHGLRWAFLTVVTAGLALAVLVGLVQAALPVLTLGGMGLAYGWSVDRRLPAERTILLGTVVAGLLLLLSLAASRLLFGVDPFTVAVEGLEAGIEGSISLLERFGGNEANRALLERLQEEGPALVRATLPAAGAAAALLAAFLNYEATRLILARFGHPLPALPPFARWQLPGVTVLGYAVALGLLYLGGGETGGVAGRVGANLYVLFSLAFLVQGLSFFYFFLRRWGVGKRWAVGILFFIALNPLLNEITLWAGMVEAAVGYRRVVLERDAGRPDRGEQT